MEHRESPGGSTERPRAYREHLEHRGAVDALHYQRRAIGADVLHPRRGVPVPRHVPHDPRLSLHRPATTRASDDEVAAVGEDIGVAAGREERTELRHTV